MKKIIFALPAALMLATSAYAADYGVVNQPVPPNYIAAPTDWTGFYAGIFAGVGGGQSALTITDPAGVGTFDLSGNSTGGIAGIQVGADYQFDSFVVGAVADLALSNIGAKSNFGLGGGGGLAFGYESTLDYLGTLRARAGFLPTDDLLAYVHGGVAFGRTTPSLGAIFGGGLGLTLEDVSRWGYTIGAGLEHKITDTISIQTEYAYTDLGNASVGFTAAGGGGGIPPGAEIHEKMNFHSVKAGVNFRF